MALDAFSAHILSVLANASRLDAVAQLRSVVEDLPGPFDRIAHLNARALRAPIAMVTLIGLDEVRCIGCCGVPEPLHSDRRLPVTRTYCPFALAGTGPLLVQDAREDPHLSANPAMTELGWLAYAGTALVLDGIPVGTLCAVDVVPRDWSPEHRDMLVDLAAGAVTELAARAATVRIERQARQLRGLTEESKTILRSDLMLEEFLREITRQARALIGAHQSVSSLTLGRSSEQWITAVDLSDRYAAWRTYQEQPTGSGIYAVVHETNRPMRMTQEELEAHPRWRGFGTEADRHPPMRGWLAAPLIGRDGRNLGLIQLSDKYEGEFTAEDETVLVHFANLAALAVENADVLVDHKGVAHTHASHAVLPAIPGVEAVARHEAAEQS